MIGALAEWLKASVLKTGKGNALREFESLTLRQHFDLISVAVGGIPDGGHEVRGRLETLKVKLWQDQQSQK